MDFLKKQPQASLEDYVKRYFRIGALLTTTKAFKFFRRKLVKDDWSL